MRSLFAVVVVALAAACQFDTTAFGRDPETGACPDPLPEGAAAGAACEDAKDCAGTCCDCPADSGREEPFVAAACVDKKCVAADEVCAFVLDNQDDACAPIVTVVQEGGACPDADQDSEDTDGDECIKADDCDGTCCACPEGANGYEAAACLLESCAAAADSCAAALAANPALCVAGGGEGEGE